VNVIGIALATDDGNTKTAITISADETQRILTSISWFAHFPLTLHLYPRIGRLALPKKVKPVDPNVEAS